MTLSRKTKNGVIVSDIRVMDYLFLDSETFGECGGYAVDLSAYYGDDGPILVRMYLHLEDEHPAVQDALADNPGRDSDWLEFYDDVPPAALARGDGSPVRVYVRPYTSAERAERARERGFTRLALPELDAHLAAGGRAMSSTYRCRRCGEGFVAPTTGAPFPDDCGRHGTSLRYVGFVERDPEANAETYWCHACVPERLAHRANGVDQAEAEAQDAECDGCGWRLADIYANPEDAWREPNL